MRFVFRLLALWVCSTGVARCETLFMQLAGAEGEATDKEHAKWSVIDSIYRGVSAEASLPSGTANGSAIGKPVFGPITVRKSIDTATISTLGWIAAGRRFDKVAFEVVRTAAGRSFRYYRLELADAFVTSDTISLTSDGAKEDVSFVFRSFKWAYTHLDASGLKAKPQLGQSGNVSTGVYGPLDTEILPRYGQPAPPAGRPLAAILNTNLLLNAGAEKVDADGRPTDWTGGSDPDFPTSLPWSGLPEADPAAIPGPIFRGTRYFGAQGNTDRMELSQLVELSDVSELMNSPALTATLAGWIGGVLDSAEDATADLMVLDTNNNLLGQTTIGPILPVERGGRTGFVFRSSETLVPPTTSRLLVTLRFVSHQQSGVLTGNAGLDELLLAISPGTKGAELKLVAERSTTPGAIRFAWPKLWTTVVVESAPTLEGPWVRKEVKTSINGDSILTEIAPLAGANAAFWRLRR